MKITRSVLASALSIAPMIFGCQSATDQAITVKTPAVETAQDQALSKSVHERLLADKKLNLSGVTVTSNDGTVYLSGTVKSLDARQQAIKSAWEVPGVKSVVNSLEVEK